MGLGCSHHHGESEEAEEHEVKMSINDIPEDAREAIMHEAQGATVKTVDQEQMDGKTIYEADAMINGQNWEIKVDQEGKLISKKLDNEESEHEK